MTAHLRRLNGTEREERDKEIKRLLEKGYTREQIAPQVRLSTSGLKFAIDRINGGGQSLVQAL